MTDRTKEIIAEMLVERVGTSFLDSGGTPKYDANGKYIGSTHGYGRAFERNQGRNFEAEDRTHCTFRAAQRSDGSWYEYGSRSINLYHYLTGRLTFAEELDRLFREIYTPLYDQHFYKGYKDSGAPWYELIEHFPKFLRLSKGWQPHLGQIWGMVIEDQQLREFLMQDFWEWDADLRDNVQCWEPARILGGRVGETFRDNTYNGESLLSQDFQYTYFEWNNEHYCILEIHGGADIRGGYTDPRIFECEYGGPGADAARASLFCENGHVWDTENAGYKWYPAEIDTMPEGVEDLGEYEIVDEEEHLRRVTEHREEWERTHESTLNYYAQMQAGQAGFEGLEMPTQPNYPGQEDTYLWCDENDQGHCPLCGGVLDMDFYDGG